MRIAITGANGTIGKFLLPTLTTEGHQVVRLVRRYASERNPHVQWSPEEGWIDCDKLGLVDAVIHLGGEPVADGKWTADKKKRIHDSRTEGTGLLAAAMARQRPKPKVVICASAIGFYGDRGATELREDAPQGEGFLAQVCADWEQAASVLHEQGVRTAHLRFGLVLSGKGGAIDKMLPIFKKGLGGRLGSGKQYMSWVSVRDVVKAIRHVLYSNTLSGPINVTGPEPVTNAVFTRVLGRAINRPTLFPAPRFALRAAFGEMADETLLASTRALPQKLEDDGFEFTHRTIHSAMRSALSQIDL